MNELKEAEEWYKNRFPENYKILQPLKKTQLITFESMLKIMVLHLRGVADKRARENQSVKELVRKTFGDGAAEDEDIVSNYADILNHLVREKIEELLTGDIIDKIKRESEGMGDYGKGCVRGAKEYRFIIQQTLKNS